MYIQQIEIDSLWAGKKHIVWDLREDVNVLSGINGVGKSTIINRVVRHLKGKDHTGDVKIVYGHSSPAGDAGSEGPFRFDVIQSFDRPLLLQAAPSGLLVEEPHLITELDLQLYHLQRRYLDYQVNISNRMIALLKETSLPISNDVQPGVAAGALARPKQQFEELIDDLFQETGKRINKGSNEVAFLQGEEILTPYQLSSGEKQMLAILLTALTEDLQPYTLLMDEPEVSLHLDWQKRLIDLIRTLNPQVQIILTTHSPAVIMNGWLDTVTEVSSITQ